MSNIDDIYTGRRWRIAVISPVVATEVIDVESTLEPFCNLAFHAENFFISEGPSAIEDEKDVLECLPGLVKVAGRLVHQGWDALVINCMCDPGLQELRDAHAIPVFGPAETSMHAIASLGQRFSVLDVVSSGRELVERQVASYGVKANFVSHRAIDTPVLELFRNPADTVSALETASLKAFEDGAETLLLGCTGLAELVADLRSRLKTRGFYQPVVEPLRTTLAIARALFSVDAAADRGRRP